MMEQVKEEEIVVGLHHVVDDENLIHIMFVVEIGDYSNQTYVDG